MSSGLYNTHKIDFDTTLDLTKLKPYGDTMNDGKVQTSFTLPLKADVLLVSQTVTQKDVHIQNLTNLIELLEAEGLRDKFVVCCGGPRITHELAKELGYDAGFGAGKYADDVASFAVTEMVKRGMGK